MVEILSRLSSPEFWLSVIIGPIVAALAVEHLKGKNARQWIKGLAFLTAAIALVSGISVVATDGISVHTLSTIAYSLFLYWIASQTIPNIHTFVVATINVPVILLIGAAIYHLGIDATSKSMIIFAYIYLLLSVVVSLLAIAWAAGARKEDIEPK